MGHSLRSQNLMPDLEAPPTPLRPGDFPPTCDRVGEGLASTHCQAPSGPTAPGTQWVCKTNRQTPSTSAVPRHCTRHSPALGPETAWGGCVTGPRPHTASWEGSPAGRGRALGPDQARDVFLPPWANIYFPAGQDASTLIGGKVPFQKINPTGTVSTGNNSCLGAGCTWLVVPVTAPQGLSLLSARLPSSQGCSEDPMR